MSGTLFMGNPSAGATREMALTSTTVTTTGTGLGRTVMLPAGQWDMSGMNQRVFPGFPSVAQNTENFTSSHGPLTFGPGLGAGNVAWCPQFTGCLGYTSGTVDQGFIGVTPGARVFGGAFRILRHIRIGSGAWFVINPGTATVTKTVAFNKNLRGVTPTPNGISTATRDGVPIVNTTMTVNTNNQPWSAGITNGLTVIDINPPNQNFQNVLLGADGSITNPPPATDPFVFVGTSTAFDPPDGVATGFKMTTGTIVGSDATPMTTGGGPFTFTTMGYDNRDASGNGNIQLVGGAVAYAGFTGNVFFRTAVLRLAVPEPATGLGIAAGVTAIAALGARRRRKQA